MRTWTFTLIVALIESTSVARAQVPGSGGRDLAPSRTLTATRATTPPRLDGLDNDAV
jgi:hypothetical protein